MDLTFGWFKLELICDFCECRDFVRLTKNFLNPLKMPIVRNYFMIYFIFWIISNMRFFMDHLESFDLFSEFEINSIKTIERSTTSMTPHWKYREDVLIPFIIHLLLGKNVFVTKGKHELYCSWIVSWNSWNFCPTDYHFSDFKVWKII